MPQYKVQLKQGQRTIVNHIEAKSLQSVIDFYSQVSTMKLTEILKVEYQADGIIPSDDFQYTKLFKGLLKHETDTSRVSRQLILHNIKNTINETELFALIKTHLEVNGQSVTGVYAGLFKK
ncbi:MAG: hypothetical protein RQ763_06055 [Sulfurimonas sp.]|uniref:hypothetical protein n=1 Tax=Sulfurimonas sp. TaxID=2022749 RepID=UPI0028CF4A41|nr:hypothetical protein [Sulfurimonas sp.]MDT8338741.1 hypothetical protein [Sulfurimonas sp.]